MNLSFSVVGCGLIGGSIALRLQLEGCSVTVWDDDAATRDAAALAGLDVASDLGKCVRDAGLVVIATPPRQIVPMALRSLESIPSGSTVMDVCSVKAYVIETLTSQFARRNRSFVPTHPMTGKATTGFANAEARLFDGCTWVLCDSTSRGEICGELACMLGATKVVVRDPSVHDRQVAVVSHLPQLLTMALAPSLREIIKEDPRHIEALKRPASLKALRLLGSPIGMWRDIARYNRESIAEAVVLAREGVTLSRALLVRPRVAALPDDAVMGVLAIMSAVLRDVATSNDVRYPGTFELAGPGFQSAASMAAQHVSGGAFEHGLRAVATALDTVDAMLDDLDVAVEIFVSANDLAREVGIMGIDSGGTAR